MCDIITLFYMQVGSMVLDGSAEPNKYFFRKGMPSMPQRVSSDTALAAAFDEWLHRCGTSDTSQRGCSFSGGSYDQVCVDESRSYLTTTAFIS